MAPPKLFISYSWTTPEHEAWVLKLAEDLTSTGVDVILDKWHLHDGHDTHAFMEQANDPSVQKVALICDRGYVEKANGRTGGVGIEAQIITPGVYAKHDQTKYVAVVVERNEDGSACVPTYYGSKKYIDFTDASQEATNFEKLQRWIFDKPIYIKPAIGKPPVFLTENESAVRLATGPAQRRASDALRNARPNADAAVSEYFDLFFAEIEKFRINFDGDGTDDLFMNNIEAYTPYRNELIDVFNAIALYNDTQETRDTIRSFFERFIPLQSRPEHVHQCRDVDFDNYCFMAHELFLYAFASYLKHQKFDAAQEMVNREYYTGSSTAHFQQSTIGYDVFRPYLRILEIRNNRLNLKRTSLHADLLHDRCVGLPIDFAQIMEADFALFLHSAFNELNHSRWYPVSLVYLGRHYRALPIFGRAKSATYFQRIAALFDVSSSDDFRQKVARIIAARDQLPSWNFTRLDVGMLSGAQEIATSK